MRAPRAELAAIPPRREIAGPTELQSGKRVFSMPDVFQQTADLLLEIETEDSTLSMHTNLLIWYVPPMAAGKPGVIADKVSIAGTAVPGLSGNSVNRGAPITLRKGPYVYWSESDNTIGL